MASETALQSLPPEKSKRRIFIDGKEISADRVEIIYDDISLPENEEAGSLHINATEEGLVLDVYNTSEANSNVGTSSETAQEIVERLCEKP